jgi:hypothetical protein
MNTNSTEVTDIIDGKIRQIINCPSVTALISKHADRKFHASLSEITKEDIPADICKRCNIVELPTESGEPQQ